MRMTADYPRFDEVLTQLDAGDVERLRELLTEEPELVRAPATSGSERPGAVDWLPHPECSATRSFRRP
tara:strand:+ start:177 stop:380 length:204 start_codon:yes stop_codon:yes gene_type:complete